MDPVTVAALTKPAMALANKLLKPLIGKIEKNVSSAAELAYHNVFNSYASYLEKAFERHSYFNSIVFKNEQKRLLDYYLPLTLVRHPDNQETRVDSYPESLIGDRKKILVVDTAGMGKTTLLKYMFIGCVEGSYGIPIYIELRKLTKKISIVDYLIEQLSGIGEKVSQNLLFKLLESGDFVFFFDGYDEIAEGERPEVTSRLQWFIEKAYNNKFIISSREESGLIAFPQFQRYVIRPLLKDEAYTLLKKYADSGVSDVLIAKLEKPENLAIHEFLTNPLLTSLLYKSFEYKSVIPLKRHIFYRQVYEALYESHDLTKEGGEFNRCKRSDLDIDRFEHVLRCLGALSYKKGKTEFTKEELLQLIEDSRSLSGERKTSCSDIIHDITHAVPLMVEDGNYIRWSHRSIQEYFCARYICKDAKDNNEKILLSYIDKDDFNSHVNMIILCADIDPPTFRRSVIRNVAEKMQNEYFAMFLNGITGVSGENINHRRSCVVCREVYIVRVILPDGYAVGVDGHDVINNALKPVNKIIEKMSGQSSMRESTFGLSNPAVAICKSKIERLVDGLFRRIDLPFITTIKPKLMELSDFFDKETLVLKIDDQLTNPVNSPDVFHMVTAAIAGHVEWVFDSNGAQQLLEAIAGEVKAQQELIVW